MSHKRMYIAALAILLFCAMSYGQAKIQAKPPAKIDLNKATVEQISKCPGLNESLAKSIVEYRTKSGAFKTPLDLLKVKGMTQELFNKLKPKMENNSLYIVPASSSSGDDEDEPSLKPSKC